MDFDFSVVADEAQLAKFVHEKAHHEIESCGSSSFPDEDHQLERARLRIEQLQSFGIA
jgi:hypothetical protein